MKLLKLYSYTILAFSFLASATLSAQTLSTQAYSVSNSVPTCKSNSSDPDGDGWGWENGASCKIGSEGSAEEEPSITPAIAQTQQSNNSENTIGICESSSSDSDGDGWGWENGESCKVGNTSVNDESSFNEQDEVNQDSSNQTSNEFTEEEFQEQEDSTEFITDSDGMLNLASDGREDNSFPLAFPGAMGGGKFATGGRGGRVVVVNTRKNDCDSSNSLTSLNEALSMTEPRYIVFAVDGIIDLAGCGSQRPSSMKTFNISEENSDVTVACQTAPGKMVIRVSGLNHNNGMSNAIYRHCAFRGARVTGGSSRGNQRAVSVFPNKNKDNSDLIFDHSTFSWTDDDVFQIFVSPTATGSAKNITVQNSIAAEGDSDSAADTSKSCNSGSGSSCRTKGQSFDAQAGGMNALGQSPNGYKAENITFTHNFQAHNAQRNYEFKGHVIAEASNNITYNWRGKGAIWQLGYKPVPTQIRGKNNLFVRGPESSSHSAKDSECHYPSGPGVVCPILITKPKDALSGGDVSNNYLQNNIGKAPSLAELLPKHPLGDAGKFTADNILTRVVESRSIRSLAEEGSIHMSCIGASKPVRHKADQRVIDEMYSGTGKLGIGQDIRSYTSVVNASTHDTVKQRDWSEFKNGPGHTSSYDTDKDGMADDWERKNVLNVGVKDHNGDLDSDGYKNIEEFLNYMARCS